MISDYIQPEHTGTAFHNRCLAFHHPKLSLYHLAKYYSCKMASPWRSTMHFWLP